MVPISTQDAGELGPLASHEQSRQRAVMMEQEDGMRSQEILENQGRGLDLSRGVLDILARYRGRVGRLSSPSSGGRVAATFAWRQRQTGQIDRLSRSGYDQQTRSRQRTWRSYLTASIHQPGSSSCSTTRVFSVSMVSTGLSPEKLLLNSTMPWASPIWRSRSLRSSCDTWSVGFPALDR